MIKCQKRLRNVLFYTLCSVAALQPSFAFGAVELGEGEGVKSLSGEGASTVIYDQKYFSKYKVVTAKDMIDRIPGAGRALSSGRGRGGSRGFGAGGEQILIDGKRVSGKSNGVKAALGRIMADRVEHIELIRGAAKGLEVQSQGLIVNVVLKEGSNSAQTLWQIGTGYRAETKFSWLGKLTHNGEIDNFTYMLEGEIDQTKAFSRSTESRFDGSNSLYENRRSLSRRNDVIYKLATNLGYEFTGGGQLRLNGLLSIRPEDHNNPIFINDITEGARTEIRAGDSESKNWEVGGDFTVSPADMGDFKVMFIGTRKRSDETSNSDSIYRSTARKSFTIKKEKIIRGTWGKNLNQAHRFELGAEAAFNRFDSFFDVTSFDKLTNENSRYNEDFNIDEKRYEVFLTHSFTLSSDMVLQSSVTGEHSVITVYEKDDLGKSSDRKRDYSFLKPRVNFRYDISKMDQIRLKVERQVGQLRFRRFTSRFDVENDEVKKGNLNLTPDHSWNYSAAYEKRFPKDAGSVEVEVLYKQIKDHSRKMDVTEYQDEFGADIPKEDLYYRSAPTNEGDASLWEVNFRANLRLEFLGFNGAVLSGNYRWRDTDTIDPFTKKHRQLNWYSKDNWGIKFRHDLTDLGISYGGSYDVEGKRFISDIKFIHLLKKKKSASVFVNITIFDDVKISMGAQNLFQIKSKNDLRRYKGHILDEEIEYLRLQEKDHFRKFYIAFEGRF